MGDISQAIISNDIPEIEKLVVAGCYGVNSEGVLLPALLSNHKGMVTLLCRTGLLNAELIDADAVFRANLGSDVTKELVACGLDISKMKDPGNFKRCIEVASSVIDDARLFTF